MRTTIQEVEDLNYREEEKKFLEKYHLDTIEASHDLERLSLISRIQFRAAQKREPGREYPKGYYMNRPDGKDFFGDRTGDFSLEMELKMFDEYVEGDKSGQRGPMIRK